MKLLPLILLLLCFGCSKHTPHPTEKLNGELIQLVPFGTSLESAKQTVEQRQYVYTVRNYSHPEAMPTDEERTLFVKRYITADVVTNVSYLDCIPSGNDTNICSLVRFTAINNRTSRLYVAATSH
jgi:hypothetical protein